jgi:ribose-phosphate pyrophosphokinase
MKVLTGSTMRRQGSELAELLSTEFIQVEAKKFPDGEQYVRILGEVKDEDLAIIQSCARDPDALLLEYLFIADAARDLGAGIILGLFPYLSYARQDERFTAGEAISLRTVLGMIEHVGTSAIYTLDSHRHRKLDPTKIVRMSITDLTAMQSLARFTAEKYRLSHPMVVAPDLEAEVWARTAAKELNTDHSVITKKRMTAEKVTMQAGDLDVVNRDVLIVDDMISTGGTMVEAITHIKGLRPSRIVVACTHPLLIGDAATRILNAGVEGLVSTDSVESPYGYVKIAPIFAEALRKL